MIGSCPHALDQAGSVGPSNPDPGKADRPPTFAQRRGVLRDWPAADETTIRAVVESFGADARGVPSLGQRPTPIASHPKTSTLEPSAISVEVGSHPVSSPQRSPYNAA